MSDAASGVQAANAAIPMTNLEIIELSVLATVGLAVMWGIFWYATIRSKESIHEILLSPSFFRTITVMGVIAATVVLSLASRLEGNMTGAILSGIVGYVLGQLSAGHNHAPEKKPAAAAESN